MSDQRAKDLQNLLVVTAANAVVVVLVTAEVVMISQRPVLICQDTKKSDGDRLAVPGVPVVRADNKHKHKDSNGDGLTVPGVPVVRADADNLDGDGSSYNNGKMKKFDTPKPVAFFIQRCLLAPSPSDLYLAITLS
jgi:hypothetical protein